MAFADGRERHSSVARVCRGRRRKSLYPGGTRLTRNKRVPRSGLLLTVTCVTSVWEEEEAVFSEAGHASDELSRITGIKAPLIRVAFVSCWRYLENTIMCLVMIGLSNCSL